MTMGGDGIADKVKSLDKDVLENGLDSISLKVSESLFLDNDVRSLQKEHEQKYRQITSVLSNHVLVFGQDAQACVKELVSSNSKLVSKPHIVNVCKVTADEIYDKPVAATPPINSLVAISYKDIDVAMKVKLNLDNLMFKKKCFLRAFQYPNNLKRLDYVREIFLNRCIRKTPAEKIRDFGQERTLAQSQIVSIETDLQYVQVRLKLLLQDIQALII